MGAFCCGLSDVCEGSGICGLSDVCEGSDSEGTFCFRSPQALQRDPRMRECGSFFYCSLIGFNLETVGCVFLRWGMGE